MAIGPPDTAQRALRQATDGPRATRDAPAHARTFRHDTRAAVARLLHNSTAQATTRRRPRRSPAFTQQVIDFIRIFTAVFLITPSQCRINAGSGAFPAGFCTKLSTCSVGDAQACVSLGRIHPKPQLSARGP
jgi:hypothetical protein